MGADLPARRASGAPKFMVYALRDSIGANLDRIQIVKGWLDRDGKTHERVYDVAWSGNRKLGANGKLPPVGNTVDIKNATWQNTIGASELGTVWTDPDFDANERAFYYARVTRDPDTALGGLRCFSLRHRVARGREADRSGTRLHIADLVHAVTRLLVARERGTDWQSVLPLKH